MRIYLEVEEEDFNMVRGKGASWCEDNHLFYVPLEDLKAFEPWTTSKSVFFPPYEVIKHVTYCHECGCEFDVVGLVASDVADLSKEDLLRLAQDERYLDQVEKWGRAYLSYVREYPPELLKEIQATNAYYVKEFSVSFQDEYFSNHCPHCKAFTGDHFLFSEPDSPFGTGNSVLRGPSARYSDIMIIQAGYGQRGDIFEEHSSSGAFSQLIENSQTPATSPAGRRRNRKGKSV